jgi:peroxiredoxin
MLLDTPTCDFGWNAPDFTLSDPNSTPFTLRDQLGENGLLIMFICNHCPYVQRIGEQLATDTATQMDAGTNVLAIMSNDYNDYAEDNPENMLKYAKRYDWQFPYLVDHDQSVGKSYGAVCTPDFFGFNASGELQYRGNAEEMVDAMRMIADTGQGPRKQTPSMGCSIKWR